MSVKRSIIGVFGILLAVVVAAFAAAPANAAAVRGHAPGGTGAVVLVNPPAPSGVRPAVIRPNAVAPTSSPAVNVTHGAPGSTYTCNAGDLCASVWDPTTSSYADFRFYVCQRYYLSYWTGAGGSYFDNQTSDAHTYFYGATGNVLTSFYPQYTNINYDWDPVYSIRNC
ncbi:MAG TPA: hypothetical protein VL551_09025 [Actinospica sp.]|jgi:hypothetical protein|nr:hypothetical protein [Actinospica sp.]